MEFEEQRVKKSNNITNVSQDGFMEKRSCQTNLISLLIDLVD